MSRVIIKNLPLQTTDEQLRQTFGSKGAITDVSRKFTKNGQFRGFAFVGYKTESEAKAAQTYFDKTFMGLSRIQVEICASLGDEQKPRSWSKHTIKKEKKDKKESLKNVHPEEVVKKGEKNDALEQLKNDPDFMEFVEVNKKKGEKMTWANDMGEIKTVDEDVESEDVKKNTEMSDLEYLKSKTVVMDDETKDNSLTVVMRNLPFKCKRKDITQFLLPVKPLSIRLPPKVKGVAYIKLENEKQMRITLNKKNSFLHGHKIIVNVFGEKEKETQTGKKSTKVDKWKKAEEELQKEESIAESGRIFIRNLPYTTLEEDIEALFKPFGQLAEVSLPVDKFTNSGKGFAFVTFVFPHEAAKAEKDLDGTVFQGRIIHLLRAKQKPSKDIDENELSFKDKKALKQKETKSNWNALFLGMNAVAESMAEKYNISKSELLNPEASDSIAVRLALGETQLVTETKEFFREKWSSLTSV